MKKQKKLKRIDFDDLPIKLGLYESDAYLLLRLLNSLPELPEDDGVALMQILDRLEAEVLP